MSFRALAIDEHADFRRLLRYHITAEWPDAVVEDFDPRERGLPDANFPIERYQIVLLNGEFDTEGGLRWLRAVRERAGAPPVVVFTAVSDEALAVTAIKAGAVDYIPKQGLSNTLIVNALKEALRVSKADSALFERRAGRLGFREAPRVTVPGYRIVRQISSGGVGSVYLADSDTRDEQVVLKILYRNGDSDEDAGHAALSRFVREVEVISALDHPNVVRIFDHAVEDDHAYIAMEYFPAGDLKARMRAGVAYADAIALTRQLAAALAAVHGIGMLHRDVKPANVMIRRDRSPALIDFGLARHIERQSELTLPGKVFGTPYYMSPEQGQGTELDQRSDLYSLGVILYEMLTGRKLYTAASPLAVIYKHCHAPLPEFGPALGNAAPVLQRLLAKKPANRPSSAQELVAALNRC
ncbi:MAG: protein kinase [Pseudomonadota bacterium]